jgi:WD40 repeat protein
MRRLGIQPLLIISIAVLICVLGPMLSGQAEPVVARHATSQPTQTAAGSPAISAPAAGIDTDGLQPISLANASRIAPLTRVGQWGRGRINGVAWSPDGATLAVSSILGIWLYAADRLDADPRLIDTPPHPWQRIAFSPDGKLLAGSVYWAVQVWDVETGKSVATFRYHDQAVTSVAFSPDSRLVAAGTRNYTVQVWNIQTRQNVAIMYGHTSSVESVAFSPDGKLLASGSDDGTARLWDIRTRRAVKIFDTKNERTGRDLVFDIAFSPDGRLLVGASNSDAYVWDVQGGQMVATFSRVDDQSYMRDIAFSPDGKLLAYGIEGVKYGSVGLWDVTTHKLTATWTGHRMGVENIAFSPDGKRLASRSADNTVRVWDVASGQTVSTLKDFTKAVVNLAFSPDNKTLATLSVDLAVHLRDIHSGQYVTTLGGYDYDIASPWYGLAYRPDGRLIASSSMDGSATLWDVQGGKTAGVVPGGGPSLVAFSPDGKLLAVGRDNIELWDAAASRRITTLTGHAAAVNSLAFSPDGKLLASGSADKTVWIWDLETYKRLATLNNASSTAISVAFSPDGKILAATSDENTVIFWRVKPGYPMMSVWAYPAHEPGPVIIAFSPDSQILALAGVDGMLYLRSVKSRQVLATAPLNTALTSSMAFSSDGKLLALGSYDGTTALWGVPK